MTHQRIVVAQRGVPDVLESTTEAVPEPAAGEVRVRMEAAGVSGYDVMLRSRWFPGFPKVPFTPGVDVVGVVDTLGNGVTRVAPGQRVAAMSGSGGGCYAEYVCLPADELVAVPEGVEPAQAVCVVANYLTAHLAMHETAEVRRGDRVLIHGAAGGVGSALVELGRLAGLEMYGTASAANHALVSARGATPIDYRTEDFVVRIAAMTGDGVDAAFDPIGGARQIWRTYRTLRSGGRLVWFGVAATATQGIRAIPSSVATVTALKLIPDGKRTPFMPDAGTKASGDISWYQTTLASLLDELASGKIQPLVAAQIPLNEAARAHTLLERGGHAGKAVLLANS